MGYLKNLFKKITSFIYKRVALLRVGEFKSKPTVHGFTIFTRNTSLGKNTSFNGLRIYGDGKVSIGDNFHSGSGCKIITQVHNYKGKSLPYDNTYLYKNVIIGDNVWFGMDVKVLASCTIGEGAIVQAGAVVVGDIPALAIAGGNPARVFSKRDEVHYFSLKEKGCFH